MLSSIGKEHNRYHHQCGDKGKHEYMFGHVNTIIIAQGKKNI